MCCFLWSVAVYDYVAEYCRFVYVPAPHTAKVICEVLYDSLLQWNIDEKLMTVTVDNCTTNDKAIEMIVGKIGKEKLPLEGILLHMRCSAHILNLIVKDGLDVMKWIGFRARPFFISQPCFLELIRLVGWFHHSSRRESILVARLLILWFIFFVTFDGD